MKQNPFSQNKNTWQTTIRISKDDTPYFIDCFDNFTEVVSCFEVSKDQCDIVAYFEFKPNLQLLQETINQICMKLNNTALNINLVEVDDRDWVEEVQKSFKPIDVGKFYIYSSYYESTIKNQNKIAIEINPGRAFGTGEHETTKLCLEALSDQSKNFSTILDLGCGSGILALAASKLYKGNLYATDIDEVAIGVAKENSKINNENDIKFFCSNGFNSKEFTDTKFDLIFANILANPLLEMSADISKHLEKGGLVILSGFLINQVKEIENKYISLGLKLIKEYKQNDWRALVMQK